MPCNNILPGLKVTYNVPPTCKDESASKCGLIMDVHGGFMTGPMEDANTNMSALGEIHGYIVATPSAPDKDWNKRCHPDFDNCISDRALLAWLEEALEVPDWKVDKSKVHFMGFSEGGLMTWRMICKRPDLFASFVAMEGNVLKFQPDDRHMAASCLKPGSPQPAVLVQNGINDLASTWKDWLEVEAYLKDTWKLGDAMHVAGDGKTWNRTRYARSDGGVAMEFLSYTYVADYSLKGHCYPGGQIKVPLFSRWTPFGCPGKAEQAKGEKPGYNIGEEAMKWFVAHPKPKPSIDTLV